MNQQIRTIKAALFFVACLLGTTAVLFSPASPVLANPLSASKQMAPNNQAPFGWWETLTADTGTLRVKGWAVDPKSSSPVTVQVLVNGEIFETILANLHRPDIESAYRMGSLRGFNAEFPVPPGSHQICLTMINAHGGAHVSLGCKQTSVTNEPPFGWWESVSVEDGKLHIKGWAVDFDSFDPVTILVHAGHQDSEVLANLHRPDIERAYGMGSLRGFNAELPAQPGTHQVCLTMVNIPAGPHVSLGCKQVTTTNEAPIGWWETITTAGSTASIKGWALDFDSFDPIPVQVLLNGQEVKTVLANISRPDVERAYGMGAHRGFNTSFQVHNGTSEVCLNAINIPAGPNVSLGCKQVTVGGTVRPGPSNTGVPPGTRLTVHNGDLKITRDNTVIDSMDIKGLVRVEAKNVLIKNSRITGRPLTSPLSLIYVNGPNYSVTVQDSELYAESNAQSGYINGIIGMNFTLERVNIHHVIDQVYVVGDNVLVRDSWLHSNLHYTRDPNRPDGGASHDDNVQIQKGNNIQLINNTMASTHNAAVMVTQDAGTVGNLRIEGNHFSNGSCSLNLVEKERGALRGFVIKDNVFTRTQSTPGCAVRMTSTSLPFLTQSNNTWNDGAPISVLSAGKH